MKRKIWLLFMLSAVFYSMIHLGGHIPGLLHGKFTYVDERAFSNQLLSATVDLFLSFLFSLSAYLFFYYGYPAKKYLLLICGLSLSCLIIFLSSFAWNQISDTYPATLSRFFRSNVLIVLLNLILGIAFYFIRYSRYRELQEKELQLQARHAELSFLRAQINPHFLFNNLNNIYSLVYRKSSEVLNAIAGLSELLRYMLYNQADLIGLDEEISYIEKFIALQQLRYESPSLIQTNYTLGTRNISIPPLLLIPLIENAFKHGAPSGDKVWLWLNIVEDGRSLSFECINRIGLVYKDEAGGIGIENVSKRLDIFFPGRHVIKTLIQDDLFTIKLKLNDI